MRSAWALFRYVSVPELAARPLRCALMAGAVATGVALLTAMHVATQSIVGGFANDLERLGGRADLQVTFGTGEGGFPEELVEEVAAMPFVAQAAALVRGKVTFEEGELETVDLFGIDLLRPEVLELYDVDVLEREKDDFTILNDPRGVFLTDEIARERGLGVGSTVRLSGVDGVHRYTVRGVVAAAGLAEILGGRLVTMYLPAAQPVTGNSGSLFESTVDQIDIRLRPGVEVEAARKYLNAKLPTGYYADTPLQRRLVGLHTVEGLRVTLVGMSTLALMAAIFVVHASTQTMVLQRLPAMATLVTIGASPSHLVRTVVLEATLLGAAGGWVGVLVGMLLASFVAEDAASGMGLNYSLSFDASRGLWDPRIVLGAHPLGGTLVAACSAYLPARSLNSAGSIAVQSGAASGADAFVESSWRWGWLPPLLAVASGAALLGVGVTKNAAQWASTGGVLLIGGLVLGTLPVMRRLWVMLAGWLPRRFGVEGRVAGGNLLRSSRRAFTTALAIGLSVAIAVGAGSLVRSFRGSVAGWYGFAGDALVSSRHVAGGWLARPVSSSWRESLRAMPGVSRVETLRVRLGQPFAGERIAVVGLSGGLLREALGRGQPVDGLSVREAVRRVETGQAVAVSRNFAVHFGAVGEGRPIPLSGVRRALALPVVAVVPDYVSDQGSVLVSAEFLRRHWHDDLVNYFAIDLVEGGAVEVVRASLDANLGPHSGLMLVSTPSMVANVDRLIATAFADMDTIKVLVLFLTAVGVADLVFSGVLWRRREFAVLRLVGFSDAQVRRAARLEAACVAIVAALGGAVVGVVCAWIWVRYNYPVLVGYVLDLQVSWSSVGQSVAIAGLTALVAATFASRFALAQPALQTLRSE